MATRLTIDVLNHMNQDAFRQALEFLFENSAWIVADGWQQRPFLDRRDLSRKLVTVIEQASHEQRLALLQSYPDLAGRAAVDGELSAASTREHAAVGLDRLSPDEIARLDHLNGAYHERFGFPFIICAREHTKDSILASFEVRLLSNREREIQAGLSEIVKILELRLADAVVP